MFVYEKFFVSCAPIFAKKQGGKKKLTFNLTIAVVRHLAEAVALM